MVGDVLEISEEKMKGLNRKSNNSSGQKTGVFNGQSMQS